MFDLSKKTALFLVMMFMMIRPGIRIEAQPVIRYENKFNSDLISKLKQENPSLSNKGTSKIIHLTYADPKWVADALKQLWPSLVIATDTRTRSLTLILEDGLFQKLKPIIRAWDKPGPQHSIEVKVIEIDSKTIKNETGPLARLLDSTQLLQDGFSFSYDINSEISAMLDSGTAKLLAKPVLTTIDLQKAVVRVGEKVPYLTHIIHEKYIAEEIHQVDTGVDLEILPRSVSENQVLTDIQARVSSVKNWEALGSSRYPILSSRYVETHVVLKKGQTLAIAGLYDEQEKESKQGVLGLSELPFIGFLFTSKQQEQKKTDIVFLITLL